MSALEKLKEMKSFSGVRSTNGLTDDQIKNLSEKHQSLREAVDVAYGQWQCLREKYSDLLKMDESRLIEFLQEGFLNFYQEVAINPYVPVAAKGPWIVSTHGALIHDSGGYGMLGLGHGPERVLKAMSDDLVMANVMTASFSQKRFLEKMHSEIGRNRIGEKKRPYSKFLCINSGSEAMTVAGRITDIHAKKMTDPGAVYGGRKIRFLSQKGSFHGRTERPAKLSHSSQKSYQALASFREDTQLDVIEPGDIEGLQNIFANAEASGVFYEAMFIEPVMGEGNPGMALSRKFYDEVRRLTKKHGTMLVVDSIQAGLRATGNLSLCDYPGFEDCDPPDMETFSKALNAGQYPLSVLALTDSAASLYKKGVYGNTMTTNPRALEVACAVLDSLTPELRENIRTRGLEFLDKFRELAKEFPGVILNVQGTGLLFSVELSESGYVVLGKKCVELEMRKAGIGVIHGGKNALRFTPHFLVTSDEVDLVVEGVRKALLKGPIYTG